MFTPEDLFFFNRAKKYMELWKDLTVEQAKEERRKMLCELEEKLLLSKAPNKQYTFNGELDSSRYAIELKKLDITEDKQMLEYIHQMRYFFPGGRTK